MPSSCLRYCLTVPSISESLRENSASVLYPGELFLSELLVFHQEKKKRSEIWQEESFEAGIYRLLCPGKSAQIWPSYEPLKNVLQTTGSDGLWPFRVCSPNGSREWTYISLQSRAQDMLGLLGVTLAVSCFLLVLTVLLFVCWWLGIEEEGPVEKKAKETWGGGVRQTASWQRAERNWPRGEASLWQWQAEGVGKERNSQAWRDSGRRLLLWSGLCCCVGKRPPNSWCYHSFAISFSLGNTVDRRYVSSSTSCWRMQQPAITLYLPSQQGSGQESRRSHLPWAIWTTGCSREPSARSVCFFPFRLRNTDTQNGLKEHLVRP